MTARCGRAQGTVSDVGRGRCAWKQTDVTRAGKAVEAAGKVVQGVKFNDDSFTVVVGKPIIEESSNDGTTVNPVADLSISNFENRRTTRAP
jgi:hypothetical protein